jgi:hypothetical protein
MKAGYRQNRTTLLRFAVAGLLVCSTGCRSNIKALSESGVSGPVTNEQIEPVLVSIFLSANPATLEFGSQLQLQVIGVFSDDSRRELSAEDAPRQWSVENTIGSATIDPETGVLSTGPSDRLGSIKVTVNVGDLNQSVEITVVDTIGPNILKIDTLTNKKIELSFNEALANKIAADAFTVSGPGSGTLSKHPASVTIIAPQKIVLNWTDGEMRHGEDVTIAATVKDLAGNAETSKLTEKGGAIGIAPVLVSTSVFDGSAVDVTFSEKMNSGGLSAAQFELSGSGKGTLADHPSSVALVVGNTYRLTWAAGEMFDGGDIAVAASGPMDLAGNVADSSATDAGGAVGVTPTVMSTNVDNGLTIAVTFSEAMGISATAATSYTLSGAGKGSLTATPDSVVAVSPTQYQLVWNSGDMVLGGDVTITVAGVHDLAGNAASGGATHFGGGIGAPPALDTVVVQTGLTVDVTFNEPLGAGVMTAANYVVTGTGKGTLAASPSSVALVAGNTYRLTWVAGEMFNDGDITITATGVQDLSGNVSATSGTHTGGAIGVVPTMTTVDVQSGLTVDVTFSESMGTGVTTAANYTLSGTGKGSLATNPSSVAFVSGNVYRLTWATGEMFDGGNITIAVAAAQDLVGHVIASSGTDTGGALGVAPTVDTVVVQSGTTVDVTFSEAMNTGITTAANYTLSGTGKGTLATNPSSVALVSGNTYRLTWASGEMFIGGNITVAAANAQDFAGNVVTSNETDTSAGIGTAPTVSMTTSATSPTNLTLIPFTVTTSEATTNLVAGDLVVTNGSVSGFAGSGTSYSFNVTATGQGDVTVDLNTGVFTDAAGNPNSNAQSSTLTYDSIPPPSPTALNCVPGDNSVAVSWTTGGGDTLGFLAVRKYGSSPTWSPTPGTSYSNATTHSLDNYTHWLASAGAATSVTETEVFPGMPHYYAIYAYDAARNYQVAELDDCTPKPMAMLENIPPASFSGSALDVKVSGQSVTEYRYSLASSDYYCDEVSYSSWIPVATKITSVVDNGPYRLCVLGRTASLDEQVVASQTYFVKTAHVSIAHPNAMNSKVQKGDSFKIEWLDHNAADNGSGTLSFYYAASTGADCSAASSIVAGVSQNTANKWSNWDTTGVPTGTYYICIESFDGTSTHSFWANGTVTVEDYCVGGALTNTLISGSNGDGTVGDPYNICSLTQLLEMSTMTQTNKSYRLRRDIDASPTSGWNAGAGWEPRAYNFTKLDGNGYTVTGLFINRPSTDYVGLFSLNSGSTAIITDLRLTDVNITGADTTGGISGRAGGSILRSFVSGTITGTRIVGAIVGTTAVSGVIVSSCASSATVNSNGIHHGGIVGSITVASALEKLHFSGTLNSTSAVNVYLGGIIGSTSANITQCLMTGAIVNSASGSNTGGIAGVISGAGGVTISRCIYAGSISTAGAYVGGMVSTIGTTPLKILGSVNLGSITAASTQLGGFVGSAGSAPVKIVGSVFAGTITGSNSGNSVGGFVGAISTSIQSWLLASYGTGNVSGATYVGGIHGGSSSASLNFLIRGSWSSGSVACLGYCGGIVGLASGANAAVLDSFSTASVAINGNYAGGAIGYLHANAKIANTYATGSISQTAAPDFYGAGFVGLCGIGGNIANSFSIGTSATSSAGGFGGQRYADCGAYTNVHWYKPGGNTFNCINNDAASGGTNCANHSATSYFQNSSNAPLSSWDFTTMWKFPVAAGYPILGWQYGS